MGAGVRLPAPPGMHPERGPHGTRVWGPPGAWELAAVLWWGDAGGTGPWACVGGTQPTCPVWAGVR